MSANQIVITGILKVLDEKEYEIGTLANKIFQKTLPEEKSNETTPKKIKQPKAFIQEEKQIQKKISNEISEKKESVHLDQKIEIQQEVILEDKNQMVEEKVDVPQIENELPDVIAEPRNENKLMELENVVKDEEPIVPQELPTNEMKEEENIIVDQNEEKQVDEISGIPIGIEQNVESTKEEVIEKEIENVQQENESKMEEEEIEKGIDHNEVKVGEVIVEENVFEKKEEEIILKDDQPIVHQESPLIEMKEENIENQKEEKQVDEISGILFGDDQKEEVLNDNRNEIESGTKEEDVQKEEIVQKEDDVQIQEIIKEDQTQTKMEEENIENIKENETVIKQSSQEELVTSQPKKLQITKQPSVMVSVVKSNSQEKVRASQCRQSIVQTEKLMTFTNDEINAKQSKEISNERVDPIKTPRKRASVSRISLLDEVPKQSIIFEQTNEQSVLPLRKESIKRISDGTKFSVKQLNFDENEEEMKKVEENRAKELEDNNSFIQIEERKEAPQLVKEESDVSGISLISPVLKMEKKTEESKPHKSLVLDKSHCVEFRKRLSILCKQIGDDAGSDGDGILLKLKKPSVAEKVNLFKSSISKPRERRTKTIPQFDDFGRLCSIEKEMDENEVGAYSLTANTHLNLNQDMEEEEMDHEMESIQLNMRLSILRNNNI